ncbi:MAG: ArgK/MeaB family GTPase [Leptonema sp. (in: bacteria)]
METILNKTTNSKEIAIQSLKGDKFAVAKLISLFENTKSEFNENKKEIVEFLKKNSKTNGFFVGITGTPGAGKSTLLGKLSLEILKKEENIKIAILAIDPSSEISGGSLLGDRTRLKLPYDENRIFFRSQASDRELGGLGKHTFSVCRILYYLFDIVFIETVGIGQSEIEIHKIADYLFLVLQPFMGDQIQFMKSGIMEVPNAFIINKWEEKKEAQKTYYALRSSLSLIYPNSKEIPIFPTSALNGFGISDLANFILNLRDKNKGNSLLQKEIYFFYKWVKNEYGNKGIELLNSKGGAKKYLEFYNSLDLAIEEFSKIKYTFQL